MNDDSPTEHQRPAPSFWGPPQPDPQMNPGASLIRPAYQFKHWGEHLSAWSDLDAYEVGALVEILAEATRGIDQMMEHLLLNYEDWLDLAEAEAEIIDEPEAEPEPEIIDEPEPGPAGSDPQQMPTGRTLPAGLHESYREPATAIAVAIRALVDVVESMAWDSTQKAQREALDEVAGIIADSLDDHAVPFTEADVDVALKVLRMAKKAVT